jgi:hypothetical protein
MARVTEMAAAGVTDFLVQGRAPGSSSAAAELYADLVATFDAVAGRRPRAG